MEDRQTNQDDDVFSFFAPPYESTFSAATPSTLFNRSAYSSSSSGDDEDSSQPSVDDSNKRIDYMIQFLDRRLSEDGNSDGIGGDRNGTDRSDSSLPEFVGKCGESGIFKVPIRSAVHPNRPPSLDVRPHPLRETQIGRFLRTMTSTQRQLWTGGEDGALRVWEFRELYASGRGLEVEDTAPYKESLGNEIGSAVVCMIGDEGSRVVWSGHRDGRIKCWRLRVDHGIEEALSWQAHRGPVLSIAISAYGDIWSGSEGGALKVWPWDDALGKSLSLKMEVRHMAALSVERSYIDPRNQVSANGFANTLTADVTVLVSDHKRARIWSASPLTFALWDARTRDLIKVFSIDGQLERTDNSIYPDFGTEEEGKMKITASKKEKAQSSLGFFQRSRNALMGAADAVRRAATKGGFCDDSRKTEAVVISVDGLIWTGSSIGVLMRWDGNGNCLQEYSYQSSGILCMFTFCSRIWVGYSNGTVQVLDLEGKLLGGWVAHSGPVIKMAIGGGYLFTLANHGGIRGWNVTSPGPLDNVLRAELAGKDFLYSRIENLKILAGTWNVGEGRASTDSLVSWLGCAATGVEVVVVGLQEVEMGAGVLAMSAAKETVGLEGSPLGQWWLDMIGKTLDEGSSFVRVGSRQLAGLLICVWVRHDLKPHVGDVDAAAVPCGFGRAIGNKGAVGVRLRMYDRVLCFVNCHFAAHLDAVSRRNADFDHVYRTMTFSRQSTSLTTGVATASFGVSVPRGGNAVGVNTVEARPELSEADMVIFLGDFNYRLDDITYDETRDFISQRCFDWLREKDQLHAEMEAGNVFQGMREAIIRFPPTYKFERHQAGLAGYDSGEKKRIPAWCDRILYRDNKKHLGAECSLDCPVVSSVSQYDACMDVTDSDHKPVRCVFSVKIARVDESVRRQEFGNIINSNKKIKVMLGELSKVPETIVSTNNIILQNQDSTILRITNKSEKNIAFFQIICEGQAKIEEDGQAHDHRARGSFGFPQWLEVSPGTGAIKPNQIAEVSVHLEDFPTVEEFVDGVPQNSWCEDTRDEEVILVLVVHGRFSTVTRNHKIRVRHCPRGKKKYDDDRPKSSGQINALHRSDYQQLSNTLDVVEQLRNLHSP
ncbi:PREDICTED: type II inositol polyphosphate 5-phosphatase 15 isoform X1 [Camelina sativa]|uniref:Type II inositol polyphosphate 5-phosphatase 15 isoform X1 n=1 Tax=Camelina sativa TaxID=90675 RepID=A0ABM0WFN7_CAMSA|nr:PREDICTED: type II inositol polyphosphate 5-phosphatase 15 isoform X2 [Camelina sativa]XP_019093890.1 PREDICTED: type II inositol polyphosphate 5-phosphatase 15 isoform X1 [Camelina sativa]